MRGALALAGLALLGVTAGAGGAFAAAQRGAPLPRPAYDRCLQGASTTVAMTACAQAELKRQDEALNTAYRQARAGLNPRQTAKLTAAQRAWIAFRDAHCASMEDPEWGTMSRLAAVQCLIDATADRTSQLREYPPTLEPRGR